MSSWVFNVQLKTWQAHGALAMPGLKHEQCVHDSLFLSAKNVMPCNLKCRIGGDLAIVFALGDGENGRVGADSAGAATVRAAQAPARTCTM